MCCKNNLLYFFFKATNFPISKAWKEQCSCKRYIYILSSFTFFFNLSLSLAAYWNDPYNCEVVRCASVCLCLSADRNKAPLLLLLLALFVFYHSHKYIFFPFLQTVTVIFFRVAFRSPHWQRKKKRSFYSCFHSDYFFFLPFINCALLTVLIVLNPIDYSSFSSYHRNCFIPAHRH